MTHPFHEEGRAKEQAKAHSLIKRTGHKSGGAVHSDEAADAKMDVRAVHAHERNMHKGWKETPASEIEGKEGRKHLAKRARGGHTPKHKGNTKVNVIVAPQGEKPSVPSVAPPEPMVPHPPVAPRAMPPQMPPGGGRPGMGMPMAPAPRPGMAIPPGAVPPGAMPRKRGGFIPEQAGGGGGEGRINKARAYGKGGMKPDKV